MLNVLSMKIDYYKHKERITITVQHLNTCLCNKDLNDKNIHILDKYVYKNQNKQTNILHTSCIFRNRTLKGGNP